MGTMPTLSDAEKEIMKIIWDQGGSIYISELLGAVDEREWKRTTVRTFVQRLMDKGYLEAQRRGKLCEYTATLTEEEYLSRQVESFVADVFGGSVEGMLATLFRGRPDGDELRRLEDLWNRGKEGMQ